MTKKDKIFFSFVALYTLSNIIFAITLKDAGLLLSNGIFLSIGLIGCIFKDKIC